MQLATSASAAAPSPLQLARRQVARATSRFLALQATRPRMAAVASSSTLRHHPCRRSASTDAASGVPRFTDGPYDPYNCITARLDPITNASSDAQRPASGSVSASDAPLAGWQVAVKENICVKHAKTTCSSRMLRDYESTFDAACVQRLRQAGAAIALKTNCDEFGMGSENLHSHHGPVRNPANPNAPRVRAEAESAAWDLETERVAGGSSGGSAAAVRAGLARIALGTDTGGSIRLPAAYCGVIGLKPSYGLVSRWGVVSYADSLDTVGLLGARLDDVERTFDVISAPDARDPTCVDQATRQRADEVAEAALARSSGGGGGGVRGLRIGIPAEYFPAELHPRVLAPLRRAIERLRSQGAEVVPVSLATTPYALSAYYVICSAEASSNLARYDGVEYGHRASSLSSSSSSSSSSPSPSASSSASPSSTEETGASGIKGEQANPYALTRSQGFGAEVQRRLLLGTYALSAHQFDNYFLQAARIRRQIQDDFQRLLRIPSVVHPPSSPLQREEGEGVDAILHPSAVDTAPTLAKSLGLKRPSGEEGKGEMEGVASYVQDVLTVPASLAGLPAISLPAGEADDGWPVGVTVMSQWGCEKVLFRIGQSVLAP
ncbi:Trimeric GatFAB AmidoTransferase(AdT) complex subunit [Thecaphora frezii]